MIPPLIFSILAFFIVTTTTVVVLKNKAKVNNMHKSMSVTNLKLENNKYSNEKQMQNLVNEINLNNTRIDNKQNEISHDVNTSSSKNKARVENLDKRFNSYKNITTANFMGINNRMTEENKRLQDEILINKNRMKSNRLSQEAINVAIDTKINANTASFDNFIKYTYSPDIEVLQNDIFFSNSNTLRYQNELIDELSNSSNMDDQARIVIQRDVQNKYNRVNDSLNNFFGLPTTDGNFVLDYNLRSDPNHFRNWFDNYYDISSKGNFSNMDDLITKADESMNSVRTQRSDFNRLDSKVNQHSVLLDNSSNLSKTNLASFINDEYAFNLSDLASISNNASQISALHSDMSNLTTTLNQIGINDLTTESTISLSDLHNSIRSNQISISENNKRITDMFDTNFNTYLADNLPAYSNIITSNINKDILINNLESSSLSLSELHTTGDVEIDGDVQTNNLNVSGNFSIDGRNYKHIINSNLEDINVSTQVFDYSGVDNKNRNVFINSAAGLPENSSLIRFDKKHPSKTSRMTSTPYNDMGSKVSLEKGVDLYLSRENSPYNDDIQVGGKIFVDSFDDIGLNSYNSENLLMNNQINGLNRMNFNPGESLGDRLTYIDESLTTLSNQVNTTATNGGVTKNMLKNIMDETTYTSAYTDEKVNSSFRIKNLYTGIVTSESGKCKDERGNINPDKRCKTIDERLIDIENTQTTSTELNSQFVNNLSTFGLTKANADISSPNNLILTAGTLSVAGNTTLNDLTINGSLNIGANTSSSLILDHEGDLLVKNKSGAGNNPPDKFIDKLDSKYVRKNSEDSYIKSITDTATGFSYSNNAGEYKTISFPSVAHNVEGTDIKSVDIAPKVENTNVFQLTTTNYNDVTKSVNIPRKYLSDIHDSPTTTDITTTTTSYDGRTETVVSSIPKGLSNKKEILDELTKPNISGVVDPVPKFNQGIDIKGGGIKFDTGCIKMSRHGKIQICDTNCINCSTDVWDTDSAPVPQYFTSPTTS
jgi:hypothetical protein